MHVTTVRNGWQVHRFEIATKDSPTTTLTWDAPGDPQDRLVARMMNTSDVAIVPINLSRHLSINRLELRAIFENNNDTATAWVFAARAEETTVRPVCSVDWVAGTAETDEGTVRFFAKTSVITQMWSTTVRKSNDEATFGQSTIDFDTHGYERFWVIIDAISSGDEVTVEYSGY